MADVTSLLTGLRPGTPPAEPFDLDAARKSAVKPAEPAEVAEVAEPAEAIEPTEATEATEPAVTGPETETRPT